MDAQIEIDPITPESPPLDLETSRRRRRRTRRAIILGLLAIGTPSFALYFHKPLFHQNLGIVDEGLVYRMAQPTRDVPQLIHTHRLGSILNLRGGDDDDSWYVAEVAAAQEADVEFYDLPMSATKRPSRKELLGLLDMLDRCRYPLLIHCKSGSDRTGLAVGLYLMYRKGVPPEPAADAFTLVHGHVPLFGPERLHEPFNEYAAWLHESKQIHTPERLLDWVTNRYRSDDPPTPVAPVRPGPRTRRPTG